MPKCMVSSNSSLERFAAQRLLTLNKAQEDPPQPVPRRREGQKMGISYTPLPR